MKRQSCTKKWGEGGSELKSKMWDFEVRKSKKSIVEKKKFSADFGAFWGVMAKLGDLWKNPEKRT